MGGSYGMHGSDEKFIQNLVGKPERKPLFRRPGHRLEVI
jgi:hypothetical protein